MSIHLASTLDMPNPNTNLNFEDSLHDSNVYSSGSHSQPAPRNYSPGSHSFNVSGSYSLATTPSSQQDPFLHDPSIDELLSDIRRHHDENRYPSHHDNELPTSNGHSVTHKQTDSFFNSTTKPLPGKSSQKRKWEGPVTDMSSNKKRNGSEKPDPLKVIRNRRQDTTPGPTDYSPSKYDNFMRFSRSGSGGAIAHFGTAKRFEDPQKRSGYTAESTNGGMGETKMRRYGSEGLGDGTTMRAWRAGASDRDHNGGSTSSHSGFLANFDYSVDRSVHEHMRHTNYFKKRLKSYRKKFRDQSVFSYLIESQFAKFGWGKKQVSRGNNSESSTGRRSSRRIQPEVRHVAASQKYLFTDESIERKYQFLNRSTVTEGGTFEDWNPYSAQSAYSRRSLNHYGRVSGRGGDTSSMPLSRPPSAISSHSSSRTTSSMGFTAPHSIVGGMSTARDGSVGPRRKMSRMPPDRHRGPIHRPQSASSSQYYKQVSIPMAPRF